MTKRFDRLANGDKLHVQSLAALAHFDYNAPRAYSYEQGFAIMHRLSLHASEIEAQFRRMVFNVIARNQDDHVKNIAFLMDREGQWSLAPAFDVTYAYNPTGAWTRQHQMTINGKAEGFTLDDLQACAKVALLPRGRANQIVADVQAAVDNWRTFATEAHVAPDQVRQIESALLHDFPRRGAG
jgi:serine/threonine-protein kinase HipA